MGLLAAILLGLVGALFPERARVRLGLESRLPTATFTWITGLLELAAGGALTWLYFASTLGVGEVPGAVASPAWAWAVWSAIAWLCAEGAVRTLAGLVGSPCGVAPLWLLDRLWAITDAGARRVARTVAIPDRVDRPGGACAYRIASCRDRGWDESSTIEVRGEWYRVLAQRHDGAGPHPHVYLLGALTPGWIARGPVVRYDPGLVVREERGGPTLAAEATELRRAVTALAPARAELLGGAAALALSPVVCLLPERTRERLNLTGLSLPPFTFATGLVELAIGLAVAAPRVGSPSLLLLAGLWAVAEGALRTVSGFAGVDVGLFAPWLLERILGGARAATTAALAPAPVADAVRRLGDQLEIRSCRERDFGPSLTLEFAGADYHVVDSYRDPGGGLRPHVYVLEPNPAHWIDRGRVVYDPASVLHGGR